MLISFIEYHDTRKKIEEFHSLRNLIESIKVLRGSTGSYCISGTQFQPYDVEIKQRRGRPVVVDDAPASRRVVPLPQCATIVFGQDV